MITIIMRCFVAVDLAEDLVGNVIRLQEGLKDLNVKLASDFHFTLKFLGEVDVKTVGEVELRLKELADKTKPFDITVEKVGVFPGVVWVGAPELLNLQIEVEDTLGKGDFKPMPHLTIARVKQSKYLAEFIDKHSDVNIGSMRVNKIKLKKSTLTSKGPVYEDLKVFNLEG